jgi:hypothetical protein
MMNTLYRLHIYDETRLNIQINDTYTIQNNAIFDTVIHNNSYRGHSQQ